MPVKLLGSLDTSQEWYSLCEVLYVKLGEHGFQKWTVQLGTMTAADEGHVAPDDEHKPEGADVWFVRARLHPPEMIIGFPPGFALSEQNEADLAEHIVGLIQMRHKAGAEDDAKIG